MLILLYFCLVFSQFVIYLLIIIINMQIINYYKYFNYNCPHVNCYTYHIGIANDAGGYDQKSMS